MAPDFTPRAREKAPELYDLVGHLSQKAGIPMPKLFIVPTKSPNPPTAERIRRLLELAGQKQPTPVLA